MINGPPVSLKQCSDDVKKSGLTLGSPELRARLENKKTGAISLGELEGSVTGMPLEIYGAWNSTPTNTWQGFPEYTRARTWSAGTDSGDFTKDIYVGCSRENNGTDAFAEVQLCGYAAAGSYRMKIHCNSTGNHPDAPYAFSLACFSAGWMQGQVHIAYNDTYVGAYQYDEDIAVPAGYPYVSMICYQQVLGHSGNAPAGTNYYSYFTDARLRKT